MRRREWLQGMVATVLGGGLIDGVHATDAAANRELDRFGGWTGKKFKASGFFRAEKDERWWLVTPEGNAFLSFGINHLHTDLFRQDYNRSSTATPRLR